VAEIGNGGAAIGFKPNAAAAVVVLLLLFCDGSIGRDWTGVGAGICAAVGVADVVADGVLPSGIASAGALPEGGGTGLNKLSPEFAVVDAAGVVVRTGATPGAGVIAGAVVAPEGVTATGGGWAGGTFVAFVVGIVAAGAAGWLVSIAGGLDTGGGVVTVG
jgi:hypothetical protein